MHIFDEDNALANSAEKFKQLLREIQNEPLPEHRSAMYSSELDTRWMACLILCPKKFRDLYLADYRARKIQDVDIAVAFEIPEWIVPFVMDDYYDVVYATLVTS